MHSVQMFSPALQRKLHVLLCSEPPLTHPTSAQTCNQTHTHTHTLILFPLLPRWAAGHNVSLFFCRLLSHAFCVTVGSRRSCFRWPGLARDELWVTLCLDKWIKQCFLPSSPCLAKIWFHQKLPGCFFFFLPACLSVPKQLKRKNRAENVWGGSTESPACETTTDNAPFVET